MEGGGLKITMLNHLNQRTTTRLDWIAGVFMPLDERETEIRRKQIKMKKTREN